MLKRNNDLINARGIQVDIDDDSPSIAADFANFLNDLHPDGILPADPPFELHPYLQDFPLQDFDKYIIGTFPPISYACDKTIPLLDNLVQPDGSNLSKPHIPFFHGNRSSMWRFLLRNGEHRQLEDILNGGNDARQQARIFLIGILNRLHINYSDIIRSAQRRLKENKYTAEDRSLWNISINNGLINQLLANNKAKYLLFNTAIRFAAEVLQYIETQTDMAYLDNLMSVQQQAHLISSYEVVRNSDFLSTSTLTTVFGN